MNNKDHLVGQLTNADDNNVHDDNFQEAIAELGCDSDSYCEDLLIGSTLPT